MMLTINPIIKNVHLNESGTGETHTRYQAQYQTRAPRLKENEEKLKEDLKRYWALLLLGTLTLPEFKSWFRERLAQSQTAALYAGRHQKLIYAPLSDADQLFLHGQHSLQMKYFNGFLEDVEAGRGTMDYALRLSKYASSLKPLYVYGLFGALDGLDKKRFGWFLGQAEHCKDCLKRAMQSRAKGGFTWQELIQMGLPGQLKTRCGQACKCRVKEIRN